MVHPFDAEQLVDALAEDPGPMLSDFAEDLGLIDGSLVFVAAVEKHRHALNDFLAAWEVQAHVRDSLRRLREAGEVDE